MTPRKTLKRLRSIARGTIRRRSASGPARRELALARVASAFALTGMGALSVGAVAVGALAIRRLAVASAHLGKLEIDELVVKSTRGLPIPWGDKGVDVLERPAMPQ